MKKGYLAPQMLAVMRFALERDILTGSVPVENRMIIDGQETGGYYDDSNLDNVWE